MKTLKILFCFILILCCVYNSFFIRTPITTPFHFYDAFFILSITLVLCIFSIFRRGKFFLFQHKKSRIFFLVFWFGLIGFNLTAVLLKEGSFQYARYQVLRSTPQELQKWGRHFIIGYRDFEEVKALVSRGAVGGVYITHRNIKGKTYAQVQSEIKQLQALQAKLGLPPLWVAADQEGGIVSWLSPLLPHQPPLSTLVKNYPEPSERRQAVKRYASKQAKALAQLGVNLNFSPVVDLKFRKKQSRLIDRSQIFKRAISSDPQVVAEVASVYSETFLKNKVTPTLKHFPGLGRIAEDTHVEDAGLSLDISELEKTDWFPFRQVLQNYPAMLMLSHVKLTTVDPKNPSSVSKKMVTGLLRKKWKHEGFLITDDFSMHPIFYRKGGVRKASVDALDAGIDFILVSYDSDLYYEAMDAVIQAARKNQLSGKSIFKKKTD